MKTKIIKDNQHRTCNHIDPSRTRTCQTEEGESRGGRSRVGGVAWFAPRDVWSYKWEKENDGVCVW